MLRAIRDLHRYEPDRAEGNIFPWLAGLARNEIRRVLAREHAAVSLETLWSRMDEQLRDLFGRLESEPFGDDVLARAETCEIVGATMSQLPLHYREALEAKYVNGESVQQMAADWGLSEKAVESQLTQGTQGISRDVPRPGTKPECGAIAMNPSKQEPDDVNPIADQNTERLLAGAYRPETPTRPSLPR